MKERYRVHHLLKACEGLKETQGHLKELLRTDYHEAMEAMEALLIVEVSLREILKKARKELAEREVEIAAALKAKGIEL